MNLCCIRLSECGLLLTVQLVLSKGLAEGGLSAGGPKCAHCLASVQQYGLALNRGSYLLVYKVNKLLIFAVKHTSSVLVNSLCVTVATCCGHF
jgi:hypothetical protein